MKGIFRSKIALTMILAGVAALGVFGYSQVHAGVIKDCTTNSIIKCGEQSPSALISRVKSNNPGDLKAIYNAYGLTPSQYSYFKSHAVSGVAKTDGTIVVNGKVVAKNTSSIGRTKFSYSHAKDISGHRYYESKDSQVLNQNLPVMVVLNSQGGMKYAVMKACGNPVSGTPVNHPKPKPQPKPCKYDTSLPASSSKCYKHCKYNENIPSGSSKCYKPCKYNENIPSSSNECYKPCKYNNQIPSSSEKCKPAPKPEYTCDSLEATVDQDNPLAYTFVANTSSSHAQLKSADFDFGDGSTAENVTPASDSTVSVTHEYDQAKSYDVQATVNFTVTGQNGEKSVKSVQCTCHVQVTPKPTPAAPTKPTKPTKPAPKQPQAPQQLPNTGAGDVLGLFGAASLIGGIGYRIFLSRRFLRG